MSMRTFKSLVHRASSRTIKKPIERRNLQESQGVVVKTQKRVDIAGIGLWYTDIATLLHAGRASSTGQSLIGSSAAGIRSRR